MSSIRTPELCIHPDCLGQVKKMRTTVTLMYCEMAAEIGHSHDGNTSTTRFACSDGHTWTVNVKGIPCPMCGSDWLKDK